MSPKTPTIYLVRHAESAHNVSKDFNIRDPGLTELGFSQSSSLATAFPSLDSIAVIVASPLRRTIETTLAAFANILDNTTSGGSDDNPRSGGARLILDPDLQERSALPCDTGSEVSTLRERFPELDFSALAEDWHVKEGPYTADAEAVAARAKRTRRRLLGLAKGLENDASRPEAGSVRKDIVVLTHGVFMKFLAQDQRIDLPKAGWKAFWFESGVEGGRYGEAEEDVLVPVEA